MAPFGLWLRYSLQYQRRSFLQRHRTNRSPEFTSPLISRPPFSAVARGACRSRSSAPPVGAIALRRLLSYARGRGGEAEAGARGHAEAESQAEEIDKTVVRRGILTPYWGLSASKIDPPGFVLLNTPCCLDRRGGGDAGCGDDCSSRSSARRIARQVLPFAVGNQDVHQPSPFLSVRPPERRAWAFFAARRRASIAVIAQASISCNHGGTDLPPLLPSPKAHHSGPREIPRSRRCKRRPRHERRGQFLGSLKSTEAAPLRCVAPRPRPPTVVR